MTAAALHGLSQVTHLSTKNAPRPLVPILIAVFLGTLLGPLPLPWMLCALSLFTVGLLAPQKKAPLLLLTLAALSAKHCAEHLTPRDSVRGRWQPQAIYRDRVHGHLSPNGERLSIPSGSLEEGEEVQVLEPHSWSRSVVGPIQPSAGPPQPSLRATNDSLVRLRPPTLFKRLLKPFAQLRTRGLKSLEGHPDPVARPLIAALLFGERSGLDPALSDLFTRTGTRHLLAISGFHVAILAAFLCGPLAKLFSSLFTLLRPQLRGRRLVSPALFRALLILTLVPLSGSGAPVLRAACAWSLASLASLVPLRFPATEHRRRPDALSAWCLALLIELLSDPLALRSVSIQLSYAATLGLILAGSSLTRLFRAKPKSSVERARIIDEHPLLATPAALFHRLQRAALSAIAASLVAILATTPIVWHHFGEMSPTGALATPLAALIITPLLLIAWLDLLLSSILGAMPLHELTAQLTHLLTHLLSAFDRLPATPAQLPLRPQWLIAIACWTLILACRFNALRSTLCAAASIAWLILLFPRDEEAKSLEIHALDVGHGTCIVLRAPGSRVWIFDAGSRDRSHLTSAALFPLLRSWGNPPVAFVCSHLDSDHSRAFPRIASRYPPQLWLGSIPPDHKPKCAHLDIETGAIHLSDGPLLLELHRGLNEEGNEGSRTLVVRYKAKRVVLSGDAEQDGLDVMLHQGALAGATDLLLLPHHGSDSPWMGPLI
ncbi:MAG: ComEC/Rec2 family competence protein, partial [Planctomycetota bacterium]|nr:ComEC/Rec2 family competence protein [Planctomycetota bacterium]